MSSQPDCRIVCLPFADVTGFIFLAQQINLSFGGQKRCEVDSSRMGEIAVLPRTSALTFSRPKRKGQLRARGEEIHTCRSLAQAHPTPPAALLPAFNARPKKGQIPCGLYSLAPN